MPEHDAGADLAPGLRRPVRLAPLKSDLSPERRALAEDLRRVFCTLGISVRTKVTSGEFWLPDPAHPGPVTRWVRRLVAQPQ
ncbi:hypothetical protein AB0G74_30490 [Streptomyces sp. NPDC020875]|uniref:hypothetical protein n=1 Tax=Streptomyces sp. NPDC020875 TaxID=3154898 RepID=UPI003410F701